MFQFLHLVLFVRFIGNFGKIFKIFTKHKTLLITSFLTLLMITNSSFSMLYDNRKSSILHKNNTEYVENFFNDLAKLSYDNPEHHIFVESFNVWDYELISSIYKFSKFKDVKNNLYLILNFSADDYDLDVEKIFADRLSSISNADGNWKPSNYNTDWGYNAPTNEIFNTKLCISVVLRNEEYRPQCDLKTYFEYKGR